MNLTITSLLQISLALLFFIYPFSFAQAADTLIIAALPPGNLNAVINVDTLLKNSQLFRVKI